VKTGEGDPGVGIALGGGLAVPRDGLGQILGHEPAFFIDGAETELGFGAAARGGGAIPVEGAFGDGRERVGRDIRGPGLDALERAARGAGRVDVVDAVAAGGGLVVVVAAAAAVGGLEMVCADDGGNDGDRENPVQHDCMLHGHHLLTWRGVWGLCDEKIP
jgi:hypothetical protein